MIEIAFEDLRRITIGVDPAVTSGEDSDDTGLVVVGRGPCQPETCKLDRSICTGHGYVLADLTCHVAPREWARRAVAAYYEWDAGRIVAEVNNGGDMVGETIHAIDPGVPYRQVRASRGKQTRAEPASALFDQGRCHMLGVFSELEEQMTTWTIDAKWSPDRLDALVWALVDLGLIGAQGAAFMTAWTSELDRRRATAHIPKGPRGLPRLGNVINIPVCKCRPGIRRFFQGRCTVCQGIKPEPVKESV
jgi:phage terminase large subunit-like protein